MWLKRLVAVMMIITCLGLNAIVVVGFFSPTKVSTVGFTSKLPTAAPPAPTVTITATPGTITAGSFSALSWTSTGNPDSCVASDAWTGLKTAFGAESTGRIAAAGDYTYTITCMNKGGKATASIKVTAAPAGAPASSGNSKPASGTSGPVAAVYCGGATPCYGTKDVAAHSGAGNCWGWNGSRVINISGLDAGFHKAKSGISTIELSSICGKDLAPSLSGQVSADNIKRDHNPTTKANADANEIPYFVGYFDSTKP